MSFKCNSEASCRISVEIRGVMIAMVVDDDDDDDDDEEEEECSNWM